MAAPNRNKNENGKKGVSKVKRGLKKGGIGGRGKQFLFFKYPVQVLPHMLCAKAWVGEYRWVIRRAEGNAWKNWVSKTNTACFEKEI